MALFGRGIEIKAPGQLDVMRRAGLVVAEALSSVRAQVGAGITTAELDAVAEDAIRSRGAVPSFQGYRDFPASICCSVNDEVVHGIPGDRVLVTGDVVSVDCGAIVEGWHGDAAVTVVIGDPTPEVAQLVTVTDDALWAGIAAASLGGRVRDISAAVETSVRSAGDYGIVEDYTGHGIGTAMHQPPDVPNVSVRGRSAKIVEGLALAIEPMLTLGTHETVLLDDDWTVVTADGSIAAHIEHTVTVTARGAWVLTALDGGEAELTARGLPFGGR